MLLNLRAKDQILGALILATEKQTYTKKHAQLHSILKEPFIIAMANVHKHRDVLKYKDLLQDDNRYLPGCRRNPAQTDNLYYNFCESFLGNKKTESKWTRFNEILDIY